MEMHDAYPDQFFIVTSEPQKPDPKTGIVFFINIIYNFIHNIISVLFFFQRLIKLVGSQNKQVKHALLHIKFDKQAKIVQSSLICKSNSACAGIEISENGDLLVITFAQTIRVIDLKSINDAPIQNWPK